VGPQLVLWCEGASQNTCGETERVLDTNIKWLLCFWLANNKFNCAHWNTRADKSSPFKACLLFNARDEKSGRRQPNVFSWSPPTTPSSLPILCWRLVPSRFYPRVHRSKNIEGLWSVYEKEKCNTVTLFQFALSDQNLKPTRQDRKGIWDFNE